MYDTVQTDLCFVRIIQGERWILLFDALGMYLRYLTHSKCYQLYKHQTLESAMKNIRQLNRKAMIFGRNMEGRILPPLILWMLGVPGGIVLILWFFFFRD